jgi:hypothetical protein
MDRPGRAHARAVPCGLAACCRRYYRYSLGPSGTAGAPRDVHAHVRPEVRAADVAVERNRAVTQGVVLHTARRYPVVDTLRLTDAHAMAAQSNLPAYIPTHERGTHARTNRRCAVVPWQRKAFLPTGGSIGRRTFRRSGCVRSSYRSATTNLHRHQHARALRRARARTEAGICERAHASARTQTHMLTRRVWGEGHIRESRSRGG